MIFIDAFSFLKDTFESIRLEERNNLKTNGLSLHKKYVLKATIAEFNSLAPEIESNVVLIKEIHDFSQPELIYEE